MVVGGGRGGGGGGAGWRSVLQVHLSVYFCRARFNLTET